MKINIEVIRDRDQRYPTIGDYWWDPPSATRREESLQVRVSNLGDWRYNALVIVHELVEVFLIRHDGIAEQDVMAFDVAYERNRPAGDESEPGDSPDAPYHRQHCIATGVERVLAACLGVKWAEYERSIAGLATSAAAQPTGSAGAMPTEQNVR